jgi:S-adenosylmethionine:tRNA ribosyltransferase-isomerase
VFTRGAIELRAEAAGKQGELYRFVFDRPVEPLLEMLGEMPLPPYIRRDQGAGIPVDDRESYQTVFAREPGAVAAPTAGLHFSDQSLAELDARGIGRATVTLHVGLGTFKPVTAKRIEDHVMHSERYSIPRRTVDAIRKTRDNGGKVIAIGTTVVRCLEAAARANGGHLPDDVAQSRTDLFLTPGDDFLIVDRLVTNFHLPRSTLLMLVCAFGGSDRILAAYQEAIVEGYRFYSYGDAMLIDRTPDRSLG